MFDHDTRYNGDAATQRLQVELPLRWPVPIYMRVGYFFDSRFSE